MKLLSTILKIKKLFKKLDKNNSVHNEEIVQVNNTLRYPPFTKGLPYTTLEQIIFSQNTLINKIKVSLGFNDSEFEIYFLPIIKSYAAYIQLLPASENHNHREEGGLFRHGLEVALYCSILSEGVIFSRANSPLKRRKEEPMWRLACTISGLLHEISKPFSDITITNKNGSIEWNPYIDSLDLWLHDKGIDRYFIKWKIKKYQKISSSFIYNMLNKEILTALTLDGHNSEIISNLLSTITGLFVENKMTEIMLKADRESVRRDLIFAKINFNEHSYSISIVRYILDAIRRLVRSGKWKINEIDSHIWCITDGTFVVWKNLDDIFNLINKDNIQDIPRDLDIIADILIKQGIAKDNSVNDEIKNNQLSCRYWLIQPELLCGINLICLKFQSDEFIFGEEKPPIPINGIIINNEQNKEVESRDINKEVREQKTGNPNIKQEDTVIYLSDDSTAIIDVSNETKKNLLEKLTDKSEYSFEKKFKNNPFHEKVTKLKANDNNEIEENLELNSVNTDIDVITQIINPKKTKLEFVLCSLKKMIEERQGEWLTSSVDLIEIDERKLLVTSLTCLDKISIKYPGINKHLLYGAIVNDNVNPKLKLDKLKKLLYLEIDY